MKKCHLIQILERGQDFYQNYKRQLFDYKKGNFNNKLIIFIKDMEFEDIGQYLIQFDQNTPNTSPPRGRGRIKPMEIARQNQELFSQEIIWEGGEINIEVGDARMKKKGKKNYIKKTITQIKKMIRLKVSQEKKKKKILKFLEMKNFGGIISVWEKFPEERALIFIELNCLIRKMEEVGVQSQGKLKERQILIILKKVRKGFQMKTKQGLNEVLYSNRQDLKELANLR